MRVDRYSYLGLNEWSIETCMLIVLVILIARGKCGGGVGGGGDGYGDTYPGFARSLKVCKDF